MFKTVSPLMKMFYLANESRVQMSFIHDKNIVEHFMKLAL